MSETATDPQPEVEPSLGTPLPDSKTVRPLPNIYARLGADAVSACVKSITKGGEQAGLAADVVSAWTGDPQILDAERRLRACIAIGLLQFYRAMPADVVDKKSLSVQEETFLRPAKPGRKSTVMLALEAIDYAQMRSEHMQEKPGKKHGRKR